ncbi:biotin--[acetyl-CoA-carboxylase] ligase [Puia sp. P3]|uniref:biotin--[acetyl-CoA-carboxylase] ligase n=1 Tax=Puia sp. P3 TaxID=3423952 RepID=UPI003D6726A1
MPAPKPRRSSWPNDLYWNDRKAGGILIENHFQGGRWPLAIAGMGININQVEFPATARNPVSLRQITGRQFRATELARELGQCLGRRYAELVGGGDRLGGHGVEAGDRPSGAGAGAADRIALAAAGQLKEYNERLYRRGQSVRLKKDSAVFATTIKGVDARGSLLTHDTMFREFSFGEVEWVIPENSQGR